MEMNDPRTTAHPHPPSGGGTWTGLAGGGVITSPLQSRLFTRNKTREQQLNFIKNHLFRIVPMF